jgi:hypothetical protein
MARTTEQSATPARRERFAEDWAIFVVFGFFIIAKVLIL